MAKTTCLVYQMTSEGNATQKWYFTKQGCGAHQDVRAGTQVNTCWFSSGLLTFSNADILVYVCVCVHVCKCVLWGQVVLCIEIKKHPYCLPTRCWWHRTPQFVTTPNIPRHCQISLKWQNLSQLRTIHLAELVQG